MKKVTDSSKFKGRSGKVARRSFLAQAGTAVLAAGGLASLHASQGHEPTGRADRNSSGCDYDVIVIGGGFAGVTAARDCRENGLSTLLLEAKGRLGGRTLTSQYEGVQVELGGTWIHWSQPFVWAEVQRYGLEVKETPGFAAERMIALVDGKPVDVGEAEYVEIVAAYQALTTDARAVLERPYDLRHSWNRVLEADRISAAQRLDQLDLGPLARDAMDGLVGSMAHNRPEAMSYLDVLRWAALGAYNDFAFMMDAVGRFQLKDGTSKLIEQMVADGRPEVRLSTAVAKVEDLGERVRVTTHSGEVITAASAIVTVPMNVLDRIEFSPTLPTGAIEAGKDGHTGQGNKVYFRLAGQYGKLFALGPADQPISSFWTYHEGEDHTLMVAFNNDRSALEQVTREAVQASVRKYLPGAVVDSIYSYDWVIDPFARGTYPSYRPGWINNYYDDFQKDLGRVCFASGDHGEGWRGFIDGAIGAGTRAAQRVNHKLNEHTGP